MVFKSNCLPPAVKKEAAVSEASSGGSPAAVAVIVVIIVIIVLVVAFLLVRRKMAHQGGFSAPPSLRGCWAYCLECPALCCSCCGRLICWRRRNQVRRFPIFARDKIKSILILQVGDGAVGRDGSSADSGVVGEDGRKLGAGNRDAQYLASAAAVHQAKETPAPFPQEKEEGEEGPNGQQESAGRREQIAASVMSSSPLCMHTTLA